MLDVSTWEPLCFWIKTERGLFQYFRCKVHLKATILLHIFCFNVSANTAWFPLAASHRRKCAPQRSRGTQHTFVYKCKRAHISRQRGCCDECARRACYRQKRRLSKTSSREQRWLQNDYTTPPHYFSLLSAIIISSRRSLSRLSSCGEMN